MELKNFIKKIYVKMIVFQTVFCVSIETNVYLALYNMTFSGEEEAIKSNLCVFTGPRSVMAMLYSQVVQSSGNRIVTMNLF